MSEHVFSPDDPSPTHHRACRVQKHKRWMQRHGVMDPYAVCSYCRHNWLVYGHDEFCPLTHATDVTDLMICTMYRPLPQNRELRQLAKLHRKVVKQIYMLASRAIVEHRGFTPAENLKLGRLRQLQLATVARWELRYAEINSGAS